jgi:hypothetical protein
LKPKGFAGLFAGAPSVALATLGLTIFIQGTSYAATEAKSMIAGALAFFFYAALCVYLMAIRHIRAAPRRDIGLAGLGSGSGHIFLSVRGLLMLIKENLGALRKTKGSEYLVHFLCWEAR